MSISQPAHLTFWLRIAATTLALTTVPTTAGAQNGSPAVALELVASGFSRPVAAADPGDGSGRWFVAQQDGLIRIFDGNEVLPDPFLDISSQVTCCGDRGMLGFTFHPDYATDGSFFVNYSDAISDTAMSRFQVSATDPNVADPDSEEILLQVAQPTNSHNGNHLAFGPDGYLYVAMGDGGTSGDKENNAQNLEVLLGKLLRLDVSTKGLPYGIPPDNPFVGVANARDEIWAYGFRNPWRFSFDRDTGDLFLADVGQIQREEVNFQPASSPGGENYGWRLMEGTQCFDPPTDCDPGGLTPPIFDYAHDPGCSVTGGYRYRGSKYPQLEGVYLFSDFCAGIIWGALPSCGGWSFFPLLDAGLPIVSFAEDADGEIYVLEYRVNNAKLHRLTASGPAPGLFSDCFESGDPSAWDNVQTP